MNTIEIHGSALLQNEKKYSIEEYLEMESASLEKHEYYKGEIFHMAGNKLPHNVVSTNLLVSLANKLEGKPCQPFGSDLRVHIEQNSLFTYPDISIICGEILTLNNDNYNILNPSVIFEILSPTTKQYDKTDKFKLYRDIPALKEYILVEPQFVFIQAFRINENGFWELREYENIEASLQLPTIKTDIPLKEIYKNVKIIS